MDKHLMRIEIPTAWYYGLESHFIFEYVIRGSIDLYLPLSYEQ